MSLEADAAHVVDSLRDLGRIEDVDAGLLRAYLMLAGEIDTADTKDRAGLFREFRAYDLAVRSLGGDDDGDGIADLIAQLSTSVVDAPPSRSAD